jgi:hypothetical protein
LSQAWHAALTIKITVHTRNNWKNGNIATTVTLPRRRNTKNPYTDTTLRAFKVSKKILKTWKKFHIFIAQ